MPILVALELVPARMYVTHRNEGSLDILSSPGRRPAEVGEILQDEERVVDVVLPGKHARHALQLQTLVDSSLVP